MALDETANYIYLGSRDGLWRITVDKSAAPVRLWGAGLAVTCVELDPLSCRDSIPEWTRGDRLRKARSLTDLTSYRVTASAISSATSSDAAA